ncbi:terminase large subunit domain-containing protein [Streptomyces sp. Midd1]|uniref:terminase large subunit domain-containing protein n=1 Tax=Streptomyces sp. Midd3 TaxID=3161191 RepID=UPI0034DAD1AD
MAATLDWVEYAARSFEPRPDADRWPTPGSLAKVVEPATQQTPALDLVDEAVTWAYNTPHARLLVSMPPQEGKSQRVTMTGSLWALHRNRDLRIGIVSYNKPLAEGFGRTVRNWITTYNGDDGTLDLGLRIARDNGAASRWQLSGHAGGIICVGLKGSLTGRPLDALVIDDPFADKEQADSAYYRDRVWGWWQSVGSTRLAPGAPVIVILTRWHEDDIAGRLLAAEDGHRWRVLNIPALADHDPEKGQSDALGREPGTWLQSARRTHARRVGSHPHHSGHPRLQRPLPRAPFTRLRRRVAALLVAPLRRTTVDAAPHRARRLRGRRGRPDRHVLGHGVQGHQDV